MKQGPLRAKIMCRENRSVMSSRFVRFVDTTRCEDVDDVCGKFD